MFHRSRNLLVKLLMDAAALSAAFVLAFVLRFEGAIPAAFAELLLRYLPVVVLLQVGLLAATGHTRATWRYTSLREAVRLVGTLTAGAGFLMAWTALRRLVDPSGTALPLGVILLDLALSALAVLGVRALVRLTSEHRERQATARTPAGPGTPTLLIGAGRAGALVAKELADRRGSGVLLRGFLDDDAGLHGMSVAGLRVLGGTAELPAIAARLGIRQALITIAHAPDEALRRIAGLCKACGLVTKIIPPVHEVAEGRLSLAKFREVSVEDLLRRPPVRLDLDGAAAAVRGRAVLVTGAGGSIGSELCRCLARLGPSALVLVDQAENSLFHAHWALAEEFPQVRLVPRIADVCDVGRMEALFREYRPACVFHAAAHKHVPMMEWNPGEAVKNNVLGTRAVANLAAEWRADWFVMISTDKAVNPTSVMGASKRVAELYVQALDRQSTTRFMTVRFGNVLGSAGSVIPIFQKQIATGGPVTVTHPEMRRYFMTIPEACQLVLQAAALGAGGELFILDMGEPVKIVELARELIRLSGLDPDRDVEVRFTGLRPGEKLFEELALGEEAAQKTAHPRIFIGKVRAPDFDWIDRQIDALGEAAASADVERIGARFKEIVPEYTSVLVRSDEAARTPLPPRHAVPVPDEAALSERIA